MNNSTKTFDFLNSITKRCPTCKQEIREQETSNKSGGHEIKQLIRAWKYLTNVPEDDKTWNKVYFPRYCKPAKQLIDLFGLRGALVCMDYVYRHMKSKNLDCTFETIVSRADLYRESIAKRGN